MTTLGRAVGIRNGVTPMPNLEGDLNKIKDLLDDIPSGPNPGQGGTRDTPGQWAKDRDQLIAELAAAIEAFQSANNRPVVDGVVDPGGGTLKLMDALASAAGRRFRAVVVEDDVDTMPWTVPNPMTVEGGNVMLPYTINPLNPRVLVRIEQAGVQYFGVVLPKDEDALRGGIPHIFFTPSPWQGGYNDPGYNSFASWIPLYQKYTSIMGSQLAESGVSQILVIPFYRNSQSGNLGDFNNHWKEAVALAVTHAIDRVDPMYLRDSYEFDQIYVSSFSNGIVTQQNFFQNGKGVRDMARYCIDLDGQAAGSNWHVPMSVRYKNTARPGNTLNPAGMTWYVGGRWSLIRKFYGPTTDHNLCPLLLFHALSTYG